MEILFCAVSMATFAGVAVALYQIHQIKAMLQLLAVAKIADLEEKAELNKQFEEDYEVSFPNSEGF